MDPMQIEQRVHPDYDLALAEEFTALTTDYLAVYAPHLEPMPVEARLGRLLFGWDMDGTSQVLLARDASGRPLGYCQIELPRWDNVTLAGFDLVVDPSRLDSGAADALLDAAESVAVDVGRTSAVAGSWRDTELVTVMERRGYEVGSAAAQRRLLPGKLDWASLDALYEQSLQRSSEYDVLEVPSPVPAEHVEGLLELQRAMNDAPLDSLEIEDQNWSEARFRLLEQAMAARGVEPVRLVARRRADGAYAGFTVVEIEQERPHLGFQDDTGVIRAHRGNRLGMRLKIEMLRLLRDRHPGIVQIDTWNAESNDHMISVNDALGCFVVGRTVELQRGLG
jgi:GNAT superfamily N-acetyltransferase